jgi:hypothetical protein
MARSENVPVRSGSEESAELFPGRDADVTFDRSDPVNERAWKGASEKYSPQEPTSNLNMEAINQRAAQRSRKNSSAPGLRPLPGSARSHVVHAMS